jgi:hypothetical protein
MVGKKHLIYKLITLLLKKYLREQEEVSHEKKSFKNDIDH